MTSGQHIDYDALALEALRGVVRACLAQVSRTGLVGDHHFYIAFNTQAAGVGMSKRLKEKYPLEMTIVLQHRFWDLAVDDDRFEVKLTFDGIPERLVVPFAAVKVFYDPSVPYVLQFEEVELGAQGEGARRGARRLAQPRQPGANSAEPVGSGTSPEADAEMDAAGERGDRSRPPRRTRPQREGNSEASDGRGKGAGASSVTPAPSTRPAAAPPVAADKPIAAPPAAPNPKPAIVAVAKAGDEATKPDDDDAVPEAGGAKIFDISKFRGKK